jgi:hypothetical protein
MTVPPLFPARLPLPPHPTRVCVPRPPPSALPVAHRHQRPPPRPRAPKTLVVASDSPENLLHLALAALSHARAWKQHASPRRASHPTTAQAPFTAAAAPDLAPATTTNFSHAHQSRPAPAPQRILSVMPTTPCPYDDGRPTEAAPPALSSSTPGTANRSAAASEREERQVTATARSGQRFHAPALALPPQRRASRLPILCMSSPSPTSAARPPRREPS